MSVAERIRWAVDLLDIQPDDRVIEVGCGAGVALALIAQQLSGGTLVAIDRSAAMVAQAEKRNRGLVESGKLRVFQSAIHEAQPGSASFDKVLSINVNVHLHDPLRDFRAIASWLSGNGSLYLVLHPPVEHKALGYAAVVEPPLTKAGLRIDDVIYEQLAESLAVCVVACRRQAGPT